MSDKYMKLHVLGFGLAFAIVGAIFTFILGLAAMHGYRAAYIALIGSVYKGYSATFAGSLLGAIWAFIESFIVGVIIAALYNCFTCGKWCKACQKKDEQKI